MTWEAELRWIQETKLELPLFQFESYSLVSLFNTRDLNDYSTISKLNLNSTPFHNTELMLKARRSHLKTVSNSNDNNQAGVLWTVPFPTLSGASLVLFWYIEHNSLHSSSLGTNALDAGIAKLELISNAKIYFSWKMFAPTFMPPATICVGPTWSTFGFCKAKGISKCMLLFLLSVTSNNHLYSSERLDKVTRSRGY